MRRLVADTGPLLHLAEADGLHLLQLAGELHVPPLVVKELHYTAPALPFPAWIIQDTLEPLHVTESVAWQQAGLLDAGEAEAIALAQQIQADWFLTDDAAARLFAAQFGLEVHGSLGIVLWAAAMEHLDFSTAQQILERLSISSLWISSRVMAEAQAALRAMFL